MSESWRTRIDRWKFNLFPAYRGTGGRVTYIRHDWREVRVELPLSWRTRNYVGTIYGGSLYGAVDPMYMLMLIKNLGPDYVVWDKAATIRFRRPGRSLLTATFLLDQKVLDEIRTEITQAPKVDRVLTVNLIDQAGLVHAEVEKTIHISHRNRIRSESLASD